MNKILNDYRRIAWIILIILIFTLSACQREEPPTPTPTQIAIITRTSTITQTATPSQTATPTSTSTPSPTPTTRWDDQSQSLIPLPLDPKIITVYNTDQVAAIAVWGAGSANEIALSPDGQVLAVGTINGVYLYDSQSFETLAVLQTPHPVKSIAFSADNRLIAVAQAYRIIDLYTRDDYSLINRLTPELENFPDDTPISIHFSPDNSQLIRVSLSPTVIAINRWDTNTWQNLNAFSTRNGTVSFVNEKIDLIGIIHEETLTLQSLSFRDETKHYPLPPEVTGAFLEQIPIFLGEIAPAPDGSFILLNNGSSIIHWKVQSEAITYQLKNYPNSLPDPCFQAPDTCLNKDKVLNWTCPDKTLLAPIETIALTPDNFMFLVSRNEGMTEFRRASDGRLFWEVDTQFTDTAFSPGSEFFFGITPDGTIEKRTTTNGELVDVLNHHPSRLYQLDFSPDGNVLAAGFNDGWIRVYSTANGEMLGVLNGHASTLKFSPNGQLLAAGLHDGTLRIFELEEGGHYDLTNNHLAAVTDLVFSDNGNQILTGSEDCTASQWDIVDRYRIKNVTPNKLDPFRISAVDWSPRTPFRYFSGNHNGIFMLNLSMQPQDIALAPDGIFNDLEISPDGKLLGVTGSGSWILSTLSSEVPEEPQLLESGQNAEGRALAFTPNGSVLIIATLHDLQFWSTTDAAFIGSLLIEQSTPADLTVSPDGRLIALGNREGFITIYAIPENNPD